MLRPQSGPDISVPHRPGWEIKFNMLPTIQRPQNSWEETQTRTRRQISNTSKESASEGSKPAFSKTWSFEEDGARSQVGEPCSCYALFLKVWSIACGHNRWILRGWTAGNDWGMETSGDLQCSEHSKTMKTRLLGIPSWKCVELCKSTDWKIYSEAYLCIHACSRLRLDLVSLLKLF